MARLLRGHAGIVDDLRAERDHQRRDGALAVALVARGEVFIHAVGGAPRRALGQRRVEVKLVIGLGKNIRADVAAFHHEVAEPDAVPLRIFHPLADIRHGGDVRHGGGGLRHADFLLGKIIIYQQTHRAQAVLLGALQFRLPLAARGGDGFFVVHVHVLEQAMPRQRAIHRAGVHINVAERLGHELGIRALAAGAGAVNRNDNRIFFQNKNSIPNNFSNELKRAGS